MSNILVVDDDENTLMSQEALLEDAGYHTTTAWGAEEGVRAIESGHFDLVLLDDYLPGADSEALMNQANAAHVPVVMLSTRRVPLNAKIGNIEAVCKWEPEEIREKVDGILAMQHAA